MAREHNHDYDTQSENWRDRDRDYRDRDERGIPRHDYVNRERSDRVFHREDRGTSHHDDLAGRYGGYGTYGGSQRDAWQNRDANRRGYGGYGDSRSQDYADRYASQRDYGGSRYGYGDSYDTRREGNYGSGRYGQERSLWDRSTDEVSSWFGDRGAEYRRQQDEYRGRGPKGYSRSDERIQEDINERLTDDWSVDASGIEVSVKSGQVTLSGEVENRMAKRRAEDIAEAVSGVKACQNNIRVRQSTGKETSAMTGSTGTNKSTSL